MYEIANNFLADRIQTLGRSPEGEHGLLPAFVTPLTKVWLSLRLLHKKFRGKLQLLHVKKRFNGLQLLRDKKFRETLDGIPGTRTPGHRSPGPWSQGIFLFYFIFYFGGSSFFSTKKNIVFSLFFLSFSLSFSLSLNTHVGFF